MEILYKNSNVPRNVALILGFFDGIHAGHIDVINNTPKIPKVLVTFSNSPAEYFRKNVKYIYSREFNYDLLKELSIDYIYEQNFSEIAHLTADKYLKKMVEIFSPKSITTGFNHTFGANRQGNAEFLENNQIGFEYYCTAPTLIDNEVVSSTRIKEHLECGELQKANTFLTRNFSVESKVIAGEKIGRKIGYPTANLKYPEDIVKIPYGVYKVKCLGRLAVMNWGVKPTFDSSEVMEVHIPNFNEDLYGKNIRVEIFSKIRDEKKFNNIDELKAQINEDIKICLK